VQAVGGALAASAGYTNYSLLQHGNRAIIAGITLQVVVLLFFGATATDYFVRTRRWILLRGELVVNDGTTVAVTVNEEAVALWGDKKFRMFGYAVAGAYSGILIRCIYR
jgi:hypothetical protein